MSQNPQDGSQTAYISNFRENRLFRPSWAPVLTYTIKGKSSEREKEKNRIWTIEEFKFNLFNGFHSILCVDYVRV